MKLLQSFPWELSETGLAAACIGTLVRTIALCLIAWPVCVIVERSIRRRSDEWRPLLFVAVLAPGLFPELLVGYTYRSTALTSVRNAEWICFGLLLIRIVPIGVVTLLASPESIASRAATYCRWLLVRKNPGSLREWIPFGWCLWHGPVRRALPALGLMSVVAFQEFELAALLQTVSWTDWFIAAQRGGLERELMLRQSLWPVLIQLPLLIGVVRLTVRQHESLVESGDERSGHRWSDAFAIGYSAISLWFGCLLPLKFMASNLGPGLTMLIRQPSQSTGVLQEIVIAVAISACAALTTWSCSQWFLSPTQANPGWSFVRQSLLLPGLAGSLLLGLSTGALFQQPWFRPLYDTPVPWVVALIIWLLPRAVLVRLWLETVEQTESVHLAEVVSSRRSQRIRFGTVDNSTTSSHQSSALLFRLRDQPRLLAIGLLCYWAYLDLSSAYLLAPSAMPSGLVRLYNFMHFGRTSALSAEAFLFFGGPLLVIVMGIWIAAFIRGRR